MNIKFTQNNYNQQPIFMGHSRNLHKVLDKVLMKQNITQQDELVLSSAIEKAYSSIITPEKFIGQGTHNSVFKITRKYAARVANEMANDKNSLAGSIKLGKGMFRSLTNYFGEAIIEFGHFQILKNLGKHTPAGVPEHISKRLSPNQINNYYLTKYLPRFSDLSQGSYDDFAKNLAKLNEIKSGFRQYCAFDSLNPNNVVVKRGKLYLVDEIDTHQNRPYANTSAKLLEVFINRATSEQLSPFGNDEQVKLVRKIFKKVLTAASKAQLMHADSEMDFKNWKLALERCKIKENASEVISTIETIEYQEKDPHKKIDKLHAYINKLFIAN